MKQIKEYFGKIVSLSNKDRETFSYKSGIGKKLVQLTKEKAGEQSMVLLLSVPEAMDYYPKIGFIKQENSFLLSRTR